MTTTLAISDCLTSCWLPHYYYDGKGDDDDESNDNDNYSDGDDDHRRKSVSSRKDLMRS